MDITTQDIKEFIDHIVSDFELDFDEQQYKVYRVYNHQYDTGIFYSYIVRNKAQLTMLRVPRGSSLDTHHIIDVILIMQNLCLANKYYAQKQINSTIDFYIQRGFLTEREDVDLTRGITKRKSSFRAKITDVLMIGDVNVMDLEPKERRKYFREIVEKYGNSFTNDKLAYLFGVTPRTYYRWLNKLEKRDE